VWKEQQFTVKAYWKDPSLVQGEPPPSLETQSNTFLVWAYLHELLQIPQRALHKYLRNKGVQDTVSEGITECGWPQEYFMRHTTKEKEDDDAEAAHGGDGGGGGLPPEHCMALPLVLWVLAVLPALRQTAKATKPASLGLLMAMASIAVQGLLHVPEAKRVMCMPLTNMFKQQMALFRLTVGLGGAITGFMSILERCPDLAKACKQLEKEGAFLELPVGALLADVIQFKDLVVFGLAAVPSV
jgi:hypothetical protein